MKIIAGLITKNANHYLKESIESYIDYVDKLIVVDDMSTDNTLDICSSFGSKVKIIRNEFNRDKSKQRQVYVDEANEGDYIICPDSDEVFTEKQMQYINNFITRKGNLTFYIKHINFWKRYDTVIHGHVWDQHHQRGFLKINGMTYANMHHTISYMNDSFIKFAKKYDKAIIHDDNLNVHHYGWIKASDAVFDKVEYYMKRDNPNCRTKEGEVDESLAREYALKHPFFSNDFSFNRYGEEGLYCCGSARGKVDHIVSYHFPHPKNIQRYHNYKELGGIISEKRAKQKLPR